MTAENSCGEPEYWDGRSPKDTPQVEKLKKELLQAKLARQETELNRLEEQHIRDTHPGLKELWDEYQTMLALVKEHK